MTKDVNMASETAVPPSAVWAQTSDVIYLTLNLECAKTELIKFEETTLMFSAVGKPEGKKHELNIEFYDKINPKTVAIKDIKRCLEFVIPKADPQKPYWPRLLKDKTKPHWLKVDFNRWKDEESNDEEGMNDPDLSDLLRNRSSDNKNLLCFDDLSDEQEEDSDDEFVPGLMES